MLLTVGSWWRYNRDPGGDTTGYMDMVPVELQGQTLLKREVDYVKYVEFITENNVWDESKYYNIVDMKRESIQTQRGLTECLCK